MAIFTQKKKTRGRPSMATRKLYRKRGMRMRLRRYNPQYGPVHKFAEWCTPVKQDLSSNSFGGIVSFAVNGLENWTNLQEIFDLYKLTGAKLKIVPTWNTADISVLNQATSGVVPLPMLYIAPNRTPNAPVPTSIADIINDDYVKCIRLTKPVQFYIKNPKAAKTITQPATETTSAITSYLYEQYNSSNNQLQPWYMTGNADCPQDQSDYQHFGFKYFIDFPGYSGSTDLVLQFFSKLYVEFKEQD